MSYRFMRIFVMFDLPILTSRDRQAYSHFRKHLLTNGFLMLQKSIYCKLALNLTAAETITNRIRANAPQNGLIQTLVITEKQYAKMEYVIGEAKSETIDTAERLVII